MVQAKPPPALTARHSSKASAPPYFADTHQVDPHRQTDFDEVSQRVSAFSGEGCPGCLVRRRVQRQRQVELSDLFDDADALVVGHRSEEGGEGGGLAGTGRPGEEHRSTHLGEAPKK